MGAEKNCEKNVQHFCQILVPFRYGELKKGNSNSEITLLFIEPAVLMQLSYHCRVSSASL